MMSVSDWLRCYTNIGLINKVLTLTSALNLRCFEEPWVLLGSTPKLSGPTGDQNGGRKKVRIFHPLRHTTKIRRSGFSLSKNEVSTS